MIYYQELINNEDVIGYASEQIKGTRVLNTICDLHLEHMVTIIFVPNVGITKFNCIDFSESLSVSGFPLEDISRSELKSATLDTLINLVGIEGVVLFEDPVLDPYTPAKSRAPASDWIKIIDGAAIYFCDLSQREKTLKVVLGMNSYPAQVGYAWRNKVNKDSIRNAGNPDVVWLSACDDETAILFIREGISKLLGSQLLLT